jgi:hypothetical protein
MGMFRTATIALTTLLFAFADVPQIYHLRPQPGDLAPIGVVPNPLTLPDFVFAVDGNAQVKPPKLKPQSELEIVRYVSGEFAKVVKPLPASKKGYHLQAGKPVDENDLRQALMMGGAAANPGDTVQITKLEFREKEIIIDINGGAKKHYRWRDHLQVGIGGAPTPTVTTTSTVPNNRLPGATLILEFNGSVPDMSADDLKKDLSGFLDFSKERSAAVEWVDTLPAQFKEAIKDRKAVVGMNQEMVIAALGRPDHKVRERDPNGVETEDWIYGQPPARTIFVTFVGDRVTQVRQFP